MPDLILYRMPYCPFCVKVEKYIENRNLNIPQKNTIADMEARRELISLTGKTQVPCLVIDGEPLLESNDIIQWFEENLD